MRIKYNGTINAASDKDYASLKGTDFDKAKAVLTKDGYKEHEYGDKDDNNGYAVYRKGDKEVELTYEWLKSSRKDEYHAGKVLDVYVDDNINGACGGKKSVKAATDGKIPYDLVSMLVALRDYADVSDAYVNDEHGKLVDIADSLYNVGRDVIDKMKPEFKKVYEKYGSDYFDEVLDDVSALDSQLTRNNVNDLIADYEDRANNFSGVEGACDGKKSVKATEQSGNTKFRIDIYKKDNHDALVKREYKSFDSKEEAKKYGQSIADDNIVEVMEVKASRSSRRQVTAARKKYDTNKAINIFYESLENLNKFFKGTCIFRHTVGSVYMPDYAAYYEDDGYDFLKDLSALIKDNSSQAIMEWIEKYETNPLYLAVVNGTEDEYIQEHISGEDMNNIDPTVAEGFVDEWYNAFYNDCYKLGHEVADSICNFLSYFSESVEEADGSYDYQNDFYEMQINYFGDTVTSSSNRKTVKASRRAIMAGPGAGYTIKWNLESIKSINSFNVINVSEPDQYGLITAEADCDVDVTIEIVEAYSYYYGIDSPLNDVPAKMTKVKFEIDPEQWPEIGSLYDADVAFAEELLNNEIYDVVSNGEVMYGGGWTHSTWDGTLTDYDHDDLIEIKVTDEEIIQYVDDAVSGALEPAYDDEYDEYDEVEESRRTDSTKRRGNMKINCNNSEKRPVTAAADITNMKIFTSGTAYVDIYEDSYEQGELGYVQTWDFPIGTEFDSAEELIKNIASSASIFSDDIRNYIVSEDGMLYSDATVNVDNEEPDEAEMEAWRRGELTLYNAHLGIALKVGSGVHEMTYDEAEAFGFDTY